MSALSKTFYRFDCRFFRGDKPCGVEERCEGCESYAPVGRRILIIKLAASGDVLRTTPLLRALRDREPDCHVTWVVDRASGELLAANPFIDRLLPFDWESLLPLFVERFDLLFALDKEPRATSLAMRIDSAEKRGFGLGAEGVVQPLCAESDYAYDLGIDDELKFRVNEKSYQQIVFEIAGLPFEEQDYVFESSAAEIRAAEVALRAAGCAAGEPMVGLNTGGGRLFANKGWTIEGFARLAERIEDELDHRVLLLGGADECAKNEAIARATRAAVRMPGMLPLRVFAALLREMSAVVSGDSLGLHLALAQQRPVVALFGSTTPSEIALYGRGEKVPPRVACAPCYLRECPVSRTCMDSIGVGDVMEPLRRVLEAAPRPPASR